jgi:hypothetical protein
LGIAKDQPPILNVGVGHTDMFSHDLLFFKRGIAYGYQYSNLPLVVGLP